MFSKYTQTTPVLLVVGASLPLFFGLNRQWRRDSPFDVETREGREQGESAAEPSHVAWRWRQLTTQNGRPPMLHRFRAVLQLQWRGEGEKAGSFKTHDSCSEPVATFTRAALNREWIWRQETEMPLHAALVQCTRFFSFATLFQPLGYP